MFICLSSFRDSSLPCDLTSLIDLEELLIFQFVQLVRKRPETGSPTSSFYLLASLILKSERDLRYHLARFYRAFSRTTSHYQHPPHHLLLHGQMIAIDYPEHCL